MKISILTATYNRAKYLNKLYSSIIDNIRSGYEIEWLIMDDGSSDNTEEVCKGFKNTDSFSIRYFKQENQGKMAAINNLSKYVTGELWIECDSDDYFADNCFRRIEKEYNKIKGRDDIYAICFLKKDQNGDNMGNNFKKSETTMFDLYFRK